MFLLDCPMWLIITILHLLILRDIRFYTIFMKILWFLIHFLLIYQRIEFFLFSSTKILRSQIYTTLPRPSLNPILIFHISHKITPKKIMKMRTTNLTTSIDILISSWIHYFIFYIAKFLIIIRKFSQYL
jgi:hypothetical protein